MPSLEGVRHVLVTPLPQAGEDRAHSRSEALTGVIAQATKKPDVWTMCSTGPTKDGFSEITR